MKPAKKQTKNSSAPKIQTFFKSAPKLFVVEEKSFNPPDTVKAFYVEKLKEKLKDLDAAENNRNGNQLTSGDVGAALCSNEVIENFDAEQTETIYKPKDQLFLKCTECLRKDREKKELEQKVKELDSEKKELQQNLKVLNKRYHKVAAAYSEEHFKLQELENVIITTDRVVENSNDALAPSGEIFSPNEVRALQAIPLKKENDSTFMLRALEYAYKADKSVLKSKTLIGKTEWVEVKAGGEEIKHSTKTAITPQKVDRMKQLFIERITKCKTDSVAYGARIKDTYANKLIGNGIKNIARRQK